MRIQFICDLAARTQIAATLPACLKDIMMTNKRVFHRSQLLEEKKKKPETAPFIDEYLSFGRIS